MSSSENMSMDPEINTRALFLAWIDASDEKALNGTCIDL